MDKELIDKYLQKARVMQVATASGGRPWIASVYFVADENKNLYWLSWPERRHSQEIAGSGKVAIAMAIKTDQPVIGLQAEGRAEQIDDEKVIKTIMDRYIKKYGQGRKFYDNFMAGTNKHQMYKFSPKNIQLFDEQNFPAQNQSVN